jgi:surface rod structure-forming protein G
MPRKSWWARLPFGVRMAAGTSALLILIGGGAAGVAALTRGDAKPRIVTTVGDAAVPGGAAPEGPLSGRAPRNAVAVPTRTSAEGERAVSRNPAREPAPGGAVPTAKAQPSLAVPAAKAAAQPVVTTRTETETREIPYATRTVRDPGLPSGSKQVQTPGVAGEETLRYVVTLTDGKQTDRRLLDSTVTRQPQQEIVALGDKADRCGAALDFCVPLGRDGTCGGHRRDESGEVGENGQVNFGGNDLALLSGGHGNGVDGSWSGGRGGRGGRGC